MPYTITHRDGLTIIKGAIPLLDLVTRINQESPEMVMATDLCKLLRASVVYGSAEACHEERRRMQNQLGQLDALLAREQEMGLPQRLGSPA